MARSKGPRCGIDNCRSRSYEEGEDGYLYCQNGHRRGDLVVGVDETDFSTARRTTTRKKKDDDGNEKQYKYFKGRAALDLYLKCLQLILRHQVSFLIREKGLPVELETVVLDLWTLRILQLENQVGDGDGYDSQSQGFSASEDESEAEAESRRTRVREKKLKSTPTLIDSLAICYLGIVTLRLPITPGDIHGWFTNGKMAYKRAIKHIPFAMRDKLPASYRAILDPNSVLKYERFYSAITALQFKLRNEYGIVWPSLNYPLLMFRLLKDLALPLELYDATIRLAGYLDYNFTPPHEVQAKLGLRQIPEAQLAACLVLCVKLIYPFDGTVRYPKTSSEPAATAVDWDEWYRQLSSTKASNQGALKIYTPEELTSLQEKDVFSMSGDQLDHYLDFYLDTFIDDTPTDQDTNSVYRNALYELFPTDRPPGSVPARQRPDDPGYRVRLDVVKAVHSSLQPRKVVDENSHTMRPGNKYTYYKTVEDLPLQAKRFYEEVAKVMGLSLAMLVLAVFFAEKKLEKWKGRQAAG